MTHDHSAAMYALQKDVHIPTTFDDMSHTPNRLPGTGLSGRSSGGRGPVAQTAAPPRGR